MLTISEKSLDRLKDKIRKITKRNRGSSLESVISELNKILPGWVRYFKLAHAKTCLSKMDAWIRRKVRCYRLKQLKNVLTKAKTLMSLGVPEYQAWIIALSGKGYWRVSNSPQLHTAFNLAWFKEQGLYSLSEGYASLWKKNVKETAVYLGGTYEWCGRTGA